MALGGKAFASVGLTPHVSRTRIKSVDFDRFPNPGNSNWKKSHKIMRIVQELPSPTE